MRVYLLLLLSFLCKNVDAKPVKVTFEDTKLGRQDVEVKSGDEIDIHFPNSDEISLYRVYNVFLEDPCIPQVLDEAEELETSGGRFKETLEYSDDPVNVLYFLQFGDDTERVVCLNHRIHVEIVPKKGQPTRAPTAEPEVEEILPTLAPTTNNDTEIVAPPALSSLPLRTPDGIDTQVIAAIVCSIGFSTLFLAFIISRERKQYQRNYDELVRKFESKDLESNRVNATQGEQQRARYVPRRNFVVRASDAFLGTQRKLVGLTMQEGGTGKKLSDRQQADLVEFVSRKDPTISNPKAHVEKLITRYSQANLTRAIRTKYKDLPPSLEVIPGE